MAISGTSISNVPDFDFTVLRLFAIDYYQTAHFPERAFRNPNVHPFRLLAFVECPFRTSERNLSHSFVRVAFYRTFFEDASFNSSSIITDLKVNKIIYFFLNDEFVGLISLIIPGRRSTLLQLFLNTTFFF